MDIGTIVALGALGVTLLGGGAAWVLRFGKAESAGDIARQALAKAEGVAGELAEFKVQVAREYVTGAAIERVEERLVLAIDRLGDRLDRAFEVRPTVRQRPTKP